MTRKPGERLKEEAKVYRIIEKYGFPTSEKAGKAAAWIERQTDITLARVEGRLLKGRWSKVESNPREYPKALLEAVWSDLEEKQR